MGKQSNSWVDPEFGDAHFKEQDIMRWSLTHSFIHSFSRRVKSLTYIEHCTCKLPRVLQWLRSRVLLSRNSEYMSRMYDRLTDQWDVDYNRGITKRRKKLVLIWRIRDGFKEEVMAFEDHSQQHRHVSVLLDNTEIYIMHVYFLSVTVPAPPDSGWSFKLRIHHMKLLTNNWIAAAS